MCAPRWSMFIGYEAADHGLRRDGTPNAYGEELDELADALGLED